MNVRRPIAILGMAGVLGAAAIGGTAFAQSAPTPTPTPNQQAKANYQNFFLDRLANLLGVDRSKLDSALTQARNDTADQAAKDGKITQDQANRIKSRQGTNEFGFGFGLGHAGRGGKGVGPMGMMGGQDVVNAVAGVLGMNPQDLVNQLRSGKKLSDLAAGKEQQVKDAVVNVEKPKLDQAVQNKRITQDQENKILDQIRNADLSKVNFFHGWGMMPRGNGNGATGKPAPSNAPSFRQFVPRGAA